MRFEKCRFVNMGPFRDWTLDLTQFSSDQKLIALVGLNGYGKSFASETAMIGAFFGAMPTQGKLVNRARAADSMVESTIAHAGRRWTVRHAIDGVKGGHYAVITDADTGKEHQKKAGAAQLREWAETYLPQRSVIEASLFRFQSSEGFVQMKPGPRMAVLLRVIGVEREERKAELARAKARAEKTKLDDLLRRIGDIRGEDPGVEVAETSLAAAQAAVVAADEAVSLAKTALASAQQEAAAFAVRQAQREAADQLRATLTEQLSGARTRLASASTALDESRAIQADAEAIRTAAASLEGANAELTRLELELVAADKQIASELGPWRDGAERLKAARQRYASAQARLKDEPAIRAAEASLPELKTKAEAEREAVAALQAEWEALLAAPAAGIVERHGAALTALKEIAGRQVDEPFERAQAAVEADAKAAAAADEGPKLRSELKARLEVEKAHLAAAERALSEAEKLAARAADLEPARTDLAAAQTEGVSIRDGHAVAVVAALLRTIGRLETATAASEKVAALVPMRALAGRLLALESSDRRIAELSPLVERETAEVARIEAQVAAVETVEVGSKPDVPALESALAAAEETAKLARTEVTRTEHALARSREIEGKVAGLEADRADTEAELADWTRLSIDYGRTGIQADEVDAAGPELTSYINGCLRSCVGTRWTAYVQTQYLDSEGKDFIDGLRIMVIDSLLGEEKEVAEHSGGERTALAEAISSGLTMLGCKRSGFDRPTLVRDESSNYLDEETAPLWIKMMRHVMEFTNADRLLFVSHNPEVRRLADAFIQIPNQRRASSDETDTEQAA